MIEGVLEREDGRLMAFDELGDFLVQLGQPVGKRVVSSEAEHSAFDETAHPGSPIPRFDHAVTRDLSAGVDAQDPHVHPVTAAIASASISKLEKTFATSSISSRLSTSCSRRRASLPSTFTVFFGTIAISAVCTGSFLPRSDLIDRVQLRGRRRDQVDVAIFLHVVRAGIERDFHRGVLVGLAVDHDSDPCDRTSTRRHWSPRGWRQCLLNTLRISATVRLAIVGRSH